MKLVLRLPVSREGVVKFLVDCQDSETGGFRPVQGHDPHLLNTLSAVQVDEFVSESEKFRSIILL